MPDFARKPILSLTEEIEKARQRVLGSLRELSATEAGTPVGEGRWSPVQYLEHLVRAEEATLWRMFGAVEDARLGRPVPESSTPEESIEDVTGRTWHGEVEAPPLAMPSWMGSKAYWTVRMERNTALVQAFTELVVEAELDSVAYNHPISGPFTMRQGMEFIRFHMDRHHAHLTEA